MIQNNLTFDVDLSTFFDRVNYGLLMTKLSAKVQSKPLLRLTGKYLRAGIMVIGTLSASIESLAHFHLYYRILC